MKTARCVEVGADQSLEGLRVVTQPVAEPGPGEVRVRIQASSLNYADFARVTGLIEAGPGRVPLTDGAGIVDAVGPGVSEWSEGDMVIARFSPEWDGGRFTRARTLACGGITADGYATEYTVKPASWFTRAPRGYSAAEAATLGCAALTAWRALFGETALRPGDWVMTQGTGGVSIFALQFAKACGARVIATTSSADKAARLTQLGADHVLNYREQPDWGDAAYALADGRGVDAIVEIGGGPALGQSFQAVREGGYIGLIGIMAGWSGEVPSVALMLKNARIQGITVGNLEQQLAMIETIEANQIRPVISSTYPLDRLADAFREQASQRHFGKISIAV